MAYKAQLPYMYIVRYRDTPRAIDTIYIILLPGVSSIKVNFAIQKRVATLPVDYSCRSGMQVSIATDCVQTTLSVYYVCAHMRTPWAYTSPRQQYTYCVDGSGSVPIPHNVRQQRYCKSAFRPSELQRASASGCEGGILTGLRKHITSLSDFSQPPYKIVPKGGNQKSTQIKP